MQITNQMFSTLALEDFDKELKHFTEVSSVAIGGSIVSCSDEFFAPASDLLEVPAAPCLKGQFGPKGALFSGWETRRHCPTNDWVIIKLGPPAAYLKGFDIDTAWFNGNEAPAASVEGIFSPSLPPTVDSQGWEEVLPQTPLGPSSRHLFKLSETNPTAVKPYTHLKLSQFPDGGIARFRAYGLVSPIYPEDPSEVLDLAHAFAGGRCVHESDSHFGVGPNLLLPGRGKDMGDGWETRRSRRKGAGDFVIIKLGEPGILSYADVDTSHFLGNYPAHCDLQAIESNDEIPPHTGSKWVSILDKQKLGPGRQHYFQLINVENKVYTHVKLTIHPDGGVKRLRIFGRRAAVNSANDVKPVTVPSSSAKSLPTLPASTSLTNGASISSLPTIPALPISPEGFAPYGTVIQAYSNPDFAPKGVSVNIANNGTAFKFNRLDVPQNSYPADSGAVTGISCFRATPPANFGGKGSVWESMMFERHNYTSQAFIPMGKDAEGGLPAGGGQLVIVALNGADDKPDISTIRAFVASPSQGISYNIGVWHHSVISMLTTDYACVETQISTKPGNPLDCEILQKSEGEAPYCRVAVPL